MRYALERMRPAQFLMARTKLGFSQTAFGKRLHISRRMVQYYEAGTEPIPEVVRLAILYLVTQHNRGPL